jgi:DNA-binding LacI/PurR family transcriptional regulator
VASIKDVAQLAGVSVSTVSRVLSGSPRVDEGTRARVEKAIARIDYRPNLLARGLRSKSGNVIGLVVPEILHETFAAFIKYTERCCVEKGFDLVVGNTGGRPETEGAFIDNLLRRHVDGIIFSRVSDRSRVLDTIERWNVPAVIIDRALDRESLPTVVLDNHRAGVLAAEHLAALGHKAIGVVTGPRDIALSRERQRGFTATLRRHGLTLPAARVLEGDFKFESGRAAARAFIEAGLPITALWCHNDLMAVGALNTFARHGVRVPADVSLVGMDNTGVSEMVVPALSSVTQPFEEMCRQAVELVLAIRRGERVGNRRVVLAPGMVARESSAARPVRAVRLARHARP